MVGTFDSLRWARDQLIAEVVLTVCAAAVGILAHMLGFGREEHGAPVVVIALLSGLAALVLTWLVVWVVHVAAAPAKLRRHTASRGTELARAQARVLGPDDFIGKRAQYLIDHFQSYGSVRSTLGADHPATEASLSELRRKLDEFGDWAASSSVWQGSSPRRAEALRLYEDIRNPSRLVDTRAVEDRIREFTRGKYRALDKMRDFLDRYQS